MLLGVLTALCAAAVQPHTFMSLSPNWRMIWAALCGGQDIAFWLGRGFLLPYSPLSWFNGM